MAIDPYIARGPVTIGEGLPEALNAFARQNRQRDQLATENALARRQMDRLDMADKRVGAADERAQQESHAKQAVAEIDWVRHSPNPRQAAMNSPYLMRMAQQGGIDPASLDESSFESLLERVHNGASSFLGQGPPERKYQTVDNSLVDVTQGQAPSVALSVPQKPTDAFRNFKAGVEDPSFAKYQYGLSRAGATQVNTAQKFETSANAELGKLEATDFRDVLNKGQVAGETAATLRALRDSPVVTGPTQDFKAAAASVLADGFGVKLSPERISQIANIGQYKAAASQLVLNEQLKQKGPQTESDAKRIAETFAKTNNLNDTNKLIINYKLALAEREQVLAQMSEDYRANNGSIDGWRKSLREYVNKTPLAANNPKTGRLVFWNEFLDGAKQSNPGITDEQSLNVWRTKYARH